MNSSLSFRLAQTNDFDAILQLSEGVFSGHDYLPFTFHKWMKMDNLLVMLAFSGDRLVALAVCSIVDGGKTCIWRAGRTLEAFRGHGIQKQLLEVLTNYIRMNFPTVCRNRFTRMHQSNFASDAIAKRDLLRFYVVNYASLKIPAVNSVEILSCTKEHLCTFIFSRPVAQKLFPHNVIVVEYMPIEPLRSNIDYLEQENDLYFAVEKCMDGSFPRSVSFGVLSPRVQFVHWSAIIYSIDPVLYEAHFVHQLKQACEVIKGPFIFSCYQDQCLTSYGRKLMESVEPIKIYQEFSKNAIHQYERSFSHQSHL